MAASRRKNSRRRELSLPAGAIGSGLRRTR
jgi:hypothetical protein